jgi:DNA processing protein
VGERLAQRILSARTSIDLQGLKDQCAEHSVDIALLGDSNYPPMLANIEDPPGVLFLRGQFAFQDRFAFGVVGSRQASHYGRTQAYRFGYALARAGMTVVSGLARGIDAQAHRGALEAGGRTIAVLASGVLNVYPPEHAGLADEVTRAGVVMSEAPPLREPYSGSFPQRNRLITGLSLGLLVVEATRRSGALISARHAMEQNRDVFALPGRVDSPTSRGCHQLLRDGACLVESVDDILEQLSHLPDDVAAAAGDDPTLPTPRHPAELQLNSVEKRVLAAIDLQATPIESVIQATQLPVSQVLASLSVLELRRLIRRLSGQLVVRV